MAITVRQSITIADEVKEERLMQNSKVLHQMGALISVRQETPNGG